ncbi:hypothetical protein B0T10DRAFT_571779 [Thelonectria olida]|uniref:Uncharacterized protein n=1 Tax=Thelonectria olida TaxID=1576542 RepID=A0A9P8W412_9HYPO|nr:hypothetical protein B0T10DRAFT_571779 [Thelonectria olida]
MVERSEPDQISFSRPVDSAGPSDQLPLPSEVPYFETAPSTLGSGERLIGDCVDLEAGRKSWHNGHKYTTRGWRRIQELFLGSKLDRKIRNPRSCRDIGYRIRHINPIWPFFSRWFGFIILSVLISMFHSRMGLTCGVIFEAGQDSAARLGFEAPKPGSNGTAKLGRQIPSRWLVFAQVFVGATVCFIMSQGIVGMRGARERIEYIRQTTSTLAYSLLKTARPNPGYGLGWRDLQVTIYECLALAVAYPVALLQEIDYNTWEPDITRHCQETALALQQLREGSAQQDELDIRRVFNTEPTYVPDLVTVDCFFEIFSLQLEKEYRTQLTKAAIPAMTSHHIIYNIRNHFENLVDQGNLDERRAPIVRENIDMLAFAGRESFINSFGDVSPTVLIWLIDVSVRIIALTLPAQNCDWIINTTQDVHGRLTVPTLMTVVAIFGLSAISATILTLLSEMWQMWDPFSCGINNHAWTLGLAREVDHMVNEFDEQDDCAKIRKHGYMVRFPESEESSSCGPREFDNHLRTMTL